MTVSGFRAPHAARILALAALLVVPACKAESSEPTGEKPDARLARLASVTVPAGVTTDNPDLAGIPAVGVATAGDLKIALHLAPGKCVVVAQNADEAGVSLGVDAPKADEEAPSASRELPAAAAAAIGPSSSAQGQVGRGSLLLSCGSRGMTVLVQLPSAPLTTTGAAKAKVLPATADQPASQLIAVGPDDVVTAALL